MALPLAGCGGADEGATAPPPVGVPGVNATIAFDAPGTLDLAPGQLALISVTASPAAAYDVGFRLVGDSLDASLDSSSAVASAAGHAAVTLRAPSQPATFAVRATIKDGPSADLVVSVSEMGFATIAIDPVYDGHRPVDEWVAAVAAGTTCQALAALLPKDPEGALVRTAKLATPLFINDAPVGPALAVAVRASHYAWGCTDASELQPGTTSNVVVHVVDRPIDASSAQLSLSLAFDPDPAAYQPIASQHLGLMTAVFAGMDGQAAALLAAMRQASPEPAAFDAAAQNGNWLAQLKQRWTDDKIDWVASLQAWAAAGPADPHVVGHLASLGDAAHALFSLEQFGPLAAAQGGGPTDYVMALGFDPDDSIHLGGTLFMLPSRYLGAQIALAVPQKQTVPDALAALVGCDALGLSGMNECDSACVADLCRQGISALWQRALDASAEAGLPAEIPMNASGAASYDDYANFTGFVGSWLGKLSSGQLSAMISGAAFAVPSEGPSK